MRRVEPHAGQHVRSSESDSVSQSRQAVAITVPAHRLALSPRQAVGLPAAARAAMARFVEIALEATGDVVTVDETLSGFVSFAMR